jgi:hypothetical protein
MTLPNHVANHPECGHREVSRGTESALLEGLDADPAVGRDSRHRRLGRVVLGAEPGRNGALLARIVEEVGEELPAHLLWPHRHRVTVGQREPAAAVVAVRVEGRRLEPIEEGSIEYNQIDDRGEPRVQVAPRQLLGVGVRERLELRRDRERQSGDRREMGVPVDQSRDEHPSPAGDDGIPAGRGWRAVAHRGDPVVLQDDVALLQRGLPLRRDDRDIADQDAVGRRRGLDQERGEEREEHGTPAIEARP